MPITLKNALGAKFRSRANKKQVMAYLSPGQAEAARTKASLEGKTVQEILGEAINAVFKHHKMPAPIEAGHGRIVRRFNGRAGVRTGESNPACRTGRVAVGGWYPAEQVGAVTTFAGHLGASMQSFVEFGMRLVTKVEPLGEGWKVAQGSVPSSIHTGVRLRGRPKVMGVEPRPLRPRAVVINADDAEVA